MLTITLPLTDKQAQACVVAADAMGVEPWEIAVYALAFREGYQLPRSSNSPVSKEEV